MDVVQEMQSLVALAEAAVRSSATRWSTEAFDEGLVYIGQNGDWRVSVMVVGSVVMGTAVRSGARPTVLRLPDGLARIALGYAQQALPPDKNKTPTSRPA
jgi:hypothetical protein